MVYFISGHRDITLSEFRKNYEPVLRELSEDSENKFVVGDYQGVDYLSQLYLIATLGISPDRLTVFHMGTNPRCCLQEITQRVGGFLDDISRDSAMTQGSNEDVAFIRDSSKRSSGTAQNLQRRNPKVPLEDYYFI